MPSSNDIAWAAGLFEGEGCIDCRYELDKRDGKSRLRIMLRLQMTDEDVVKRFADIVGLGRNVRSTKRTSTGKQIWDWTAGKMDDVEDILNMFLPFFGKRRKEKAEYTIEAIIKRRNEPRRSPITEETRMKISNSVKNFWKNNRQYMLDAQAGKGLMTIKK